MKTQNKQIKFRVWVDDEKRFRYCEYIPTMGFVWLITGAIGKEIPQAATLEFLEIGENYPQQFTGLVDKNGKDVYEGDILSSEVNEKPCNYIVKWGDDRSDYCGFVLNPVMKNPPRITYHIHNFKIWMAEGFKVIGNLIENSELLKI